MSFWYLGQKHRGQVSYIAKYIRVASAIPNSSPALRWVPKAVYSLLDVNETFDLAFKLKLTPVIA